MLLFILLAIFALTQAKDVPKPVYSYLNYGQNDTSLLDQGLTSREKVKLQFYYESKSPLCMLTYITQLKDVVDDLAPYLHINTYPYGNAHIELNGTQMTITCEHGEDECYGNMLHACAKYELNYDAKRYVPFIACMMSYTLHDSYPNNEAVEECGDSQGVDSEFIKECAKSNLGFKLLLKYGIQSEKQKYSKLPWWSVNGVPMVSGQKNSLKKMLCDAFKHPPKTCKKDI